ncbi:C3a anaphylatoxin chemotactic receptor-like [Hypanus sabinus]|uniref:C3a anaphylatoxin chemotactic receptor-like n=1 Tax=Hypanus sabinus TaxID=79690 RepID=UPI0028C3D6DE|nr:C3a anaphylatoxin chemotactic receptor-like [Hypanus sabinus]
MSFSEGIYNSTLTGNLSSYNYTDSGFSMEWGAPSVVSMFINILTVLLGVPGNGAVIWVTGFKMESKAHTVCFMKLAVADLMYCLLLPLLMVGIAKYIDNIVSIICNTIMLLTTFASIYLLCLISLYRCLAITRPIWFQQHLRLVWVRATCFVVWVITILQFPFSTMQILGAFSFGLPFVIMVISYAVVGWRLHGERFVKSRKPIGLLVNAVAAFVICWLPFSVCLLLPNDVVVAGDWFDFTHALASFNSALNPLIYVFAGNDFRQVFRRSLFASLRLAFAEHELQRETSNRISTSNTNV